MKYVKKISVTVQHQLVSLANNILSLPGALLIEHAALCNEETFHLERAVAQR